MKNFLFLETFHSGKGDFFQLKCMKMAFHFWSNETFKYLIFQQLFALQWKSETLFAFFSRLIRWPLPQWRYLSDHLSTQSSSFVFIGFEQEDKKTSTNTGFIIIIPTLFYPLLVIQLDFISKELVDTEDKYLENLIMVRDKFRDKLNLMSNQDKAVIFYKLVRHIFCT